MTDIHKEPPTQLAGYLEIDGDKNKEVPYHYIPIFLYDSNDIVKLRKAEGMTIEETFHRMKTLKSTPD